MIPILLQSAPATGIPGLNTAVGLVAISILLYYYATQITLLVAILFYEALLRLDIAGSMAFAVNTIARKYLHAPGGFSILPSSSKDSDSQAQILKVETPIHIFININRAFLYLAFFLSLTLVFPFSNVLSFPYTVYDGIFYVLNTTVLVIEPIYLGIVLIVFAPLGKLIDVVIDVIKLVKS